MRPIARPAPRDTPTLWQRAREMFGVMLERARTVTQLIVRHRLSRTERREILTRLKPVEKLTRELIITEAATFLLMTPDGMKLRREARIMALPAREPPKPPPPRGALVTGSRLIATFDPRTYAVLRPNPVAVSAPAIRTTPHDANDPATWRCSFKVLRLVHPEPDDAPPPSKKPTGPRPRLITFDDIVSFTPTRPRRQSPAARRWRRPLPRPPHRGAVARARKTRARHPPHRPLPRQPAARGARSARSGLGLHATAGITAATNSTPQTISPSAPSPSSIAYASPTSTGQNPNRDRSLYPNAKRSTREQTLSAIANACLEARCETISPSIPAHPDERRDPGQTSRLVPACGFKPAHAVRPFLDPDVRRDERLFGCPQSGRMDPKNTKAAPAGRPLQKSGCQPEASSSACS